MKHLHIPYSTWKQVAQTNSFTPYHCEVVAGEVVDAWCGNADIQYHAAVDVDNYADWASNFSGSILCVSDDDAVAKIIGLYVEPPTPRENDGRLNVVSAPMTQGMYAHWTGAGDDLNPAGPLSGRGEGEDLVLKFDGPDDVTKVIEFSSYVEIYDGEGTWEPVDHWSADDKFWVYILISPNQECTTHTVGSGNCNVVDTGMGFSALIPAAGDGDYTVDLDRAKPLPMSSDLNFWSTGAYRDGGEITPSVGDQGQPTGNHALLYDLGYRVNINTRMPMGSPIGRFEVDSDKSEPIHKNWRIAVRCKKVTVGSGTLGVWFKFFRPDTTEIDYPPTVV